ncbi:MAG TPA: hypothetical protein VLA30_10305 [Burkholderiales bacterium]|nr:hypothetical protein [Burkholderiales bacterium]
MRFKVIVGEQAYAVEVPERLLEQAREFHDKLDADMDRGWQMSREFVAHPDRLQRCQIAADRLLTGLMQGNEATAMLMASYIALRMPGVVGVDIDAGGEMRNTELLYA